MNASPPRAAPPAIVLRDIVDFTDIAGWSDHGEDAIEFVITPGSRFLLLAEGLAIGKLVDLRAGGARISVKLTFAVSSAESPWDSIRRADCLSGAFGLGLLLSAESVTDATQTPVKDALVAGFWNYVTSHRGIIGDGKRVTIIAREPNAPLAECLIEKGPLDFPGPGTFVTLLETIARSLGAGQEFEFSETETTVSTFLYEAARNSWEHGRESDQGVVKGARGILVEKIAIMNDADLTARRDIPQFVQEYLQRVRNVRGRAKMFAVAFTVADYGRGIHQTLPAADGEDAWQRLLRAFERGESRKPRGNDLNWGQGLPNIVDVCRRPLAAFLFVRSAELVGFADFSLERERSCLLSPLTSVPANGRGTSLSVLWVLAEPGATHDQQTLF